MIRTSSVAAALVLTTTAFSLAAPPIGDAKQELEGSVRRPVLLAPFVPAPSRQIGAAGILRPEALPLAIDLDRFAQIESRAKRTGIRLDAFPLPDGRTISLDLDPVEVLSPEAEIVFMDRDRDGVVRPRQVAPPSSSLWAGRIVGQPDSRVFLGVSRTVCNGFISGLEGDFMIASPSAQQGAPAIFRLGTENGSIPLNLEGMQCHVEDLRGQPFGPQIAADPFPGLRLADARSAAAADVSAFGFGRPGKGSVDPVTRRGDVGDPPPEGQLSGACCFNGIGSGDEIGQCETLTLWECENLEGIYLGHGTACGETSDDQTCSNEPLDCFRVRVAIDTDVEFLNLFDGDVDRALNYIYVLVGASSQIYDESLSLRLQVPWIRLWSEDSDQIGQEGEEWQIWDGNSEPWQARTTSQQLNQFKSYWSSNQSPAVARDLMHLLSGRGLGGGIAYVSAACSANGYAVSADLVGTFRYPTLDGYWNNWDPIVFTHELGHNLGTLHTHDYTYDSFGGLIDSCAYDCTFAENYPATIMSYCHLCSGGSANINLKFHPYTRGQMYTFVRGLACAQNQAEGSLLAVDDLEATYPGLPTKINVLRNDRGLLCDNDNVSIDPTSVEGQSVLGGTVELLDDDAGEVEFDQIQYTAPCGLVAAGAVLDRFTYTLQSTSPDAPADLTDDAVVRVRVLAASEDPNAYVTDISNVFSVGVVGNAQNQNRTIAVPPGARILAVGWDAGRFNPNGSAPPDASFRMSLERDNGVPRNLTIEPFADPATSPDGPICGARLLDDPDDLWFAGDDGEIFIEFFEQTDDAIGSDGQWAAGAIYVVVDAVYTSTGACCLDALCAVQDSVVDCQALGGVFQGTGTICTAQTCVQQPLAGGACCLSLGDSGAVICTEATEAVCEAQGGTYQGDGSLCLAQTCDEEATPEGACCVDLGDSAACSVVIEEACEGLGGTYQGDGLDCDDVECDISDPSGACCLEDGVCLQVAQSLCENGGYDFAGAGVDCDEVACAEAVGACCVGTFCLSLGEDECGSVNGSFQGIGVECTTDICEPPPIGACCVGSTCFRIELAVCISQGGAWLGTGTRCGPQSCSGFAVGACCIEQACAVLPAFECLAAGGFFHGPGSGCTSEFCLTGACCFGETCLIGDRPACESVSGIFSGYGVECEIAICEGCAPDLDDNGVVDVNDLLILLNEFGNAGGQADVNQDGLVDVNDVLILISTWGGDGC